MNDLLKNQHLLRLGGISGILTGILILAFAISSDLNGIFFIRNIYSGDSIGDWIQSLGTHRAFASWHILLMIFGFASMLMTAGVLYQVIPNNSWQKNLALVSYAIGGAIIFPTIASHQSLENYIITLLDKGTFSNNQIQEMVGQKVYLWMSVNDFFGPLFIIVLGTGLMAWALKKAGLIPKWFFIWAILVSACLLLSLFSAIAPPLANLGNFAPLHMIWYSIMGVFLLRIERKNQ